MNIVLTKVFRFGVVIIASYYGCQPMFGQCDNIPGCGPWSTESTTLIDLAVPDCIAEIVYKSRVCNGVKEYFIVNYVVKGGCESWDSKDVLHHKLSGLLEYLAQGLIDKQERGNVPYCNYPPPLSIAHVYTASCGIWVGCEYEVVPNTRSCDVGYDEPFPDSYQGGVLKVKAWKWQPCGTTCCRRTFEYCTDTLEYEGTARTYTRSKLINKLKLSPCTDQAKYSPKPCEDGC